MNSIDDEQFLAPCCAIAKEAGKIILSHDPHRTEVTHKADNSPVTLADTQANALIVERLSALTPDIPIIAEEDDNFPITPPKRFWLVDPLDGTRSFAEGAPDYTVNIGLIEQGKPVLGVIYCPATDALYYGIPGRGALKSIGGKEARPISVRHIPSDGLTVVKSRSHPSARTTAFLESIPVSNVEPCGSSFKFCQVAEGNADIYPRFGDTMEWDTAAGQAILEAAGGRVENAEGHVLTYGKHGFKNPHFIAYGADYKQLARDTNLLAR